MTVYRLDSAQGEKTPDFASVNDLRAWLIKTYGNQKGSIYIFKYDQHNGWLQWYRFDVLGKDQYGWLNQFRAYTTLTKSGRSKGYR